MIQHCLALTIALYWVKYSLCQEEQDIIVTTAAPTEFLPEFNVASVDSFDPLAEDSVAPKLYNEVAANSSDIVQDFTDEQLARGEETSSSMPNVNTTLIHVHVLWRHGNRAPEEFPANIGNDIRSTWIGGENALTKKGIEQATRLGELLKERYYRLLSGLYYPEKFYIRSSDKDRTLMSAQAVFNGLVSNQDYGSGLKVFPVHTVANERDNLFNFNIECPARQQEQHRVFTVPEYGFPSLAEKTSNFVKWLQQQTEQPNLTYQDVYKTWDFLYYTRADDRTWPIWATDEVYNQLEMINNRLNYGLMATPKLLRLRSGPVLKEMSERMMNIARGSYKREEKFFGYSAHDHTLAFLLKILGVSFLRWPEPTSALVFELHRREDNEHFVKIFYRNYTAESFQEIRLQVCHGDCHLQTFLAYLRPFITNNWAKECEFDEKRDKSSQNFPILLYVAIAQSVLLLGVAVLFAVMIARAFNRSRIVNPLEKIDY
ncbi:unnamed protein product [Bursaphelenchus okinawaensis]|uniref:Acid phosphatase n=1 Tax=Bursaphelenchus okinawaensis TaxID=465554 RepID=A0A811KY44_9BILA|nr:unnamed protein product [Bursaphelenchus okinawaensis]CAG9115262.1 unnamed protein product [Bursaphelenchus okinawaensis]